MFLLNYMPDGFICLIKSQTVSQAELRATICQYSLRFKHWKLVHVYFCFTNPPSPEII